MSAPRIFAHQGGAGQWQGNSLTAFEQIASRDIDGVELDVHRTADGVLAVIHDAVISREGGPRSIASLTYDEVRTACGAEGAGYSLEAILSILVKTRLEVQIDIKTDLFGRPYSDLVSQLASIIRKFEMQDRTILSSFLPNTLAEVRRALPGCRLRSGLMPLVSEQLGGAYSAITKYRDVGVTILDLNLRMYDADLVSAARRASMEVGIATVNGAECLDHWMRQPIDRLITDEPDVALAVARHVRRGGDDGH
jgi:glycerophosphoryl diester phosphodiesterase